MVTVTQEKLLIALIKLIEAECQFSCLKLNVRLKNPPHDKLLSVWLMSTFMFLVDLFRLISQEF